MGIIHTPIAATVPFDNTLNGFASANVQEAIEEINNAQQNIIRQHISANSSTTTSSNTSVQVNGMTLTVGTSGTYLITGNLVWLSNGNSTSIVAIYNNGNIVSNTQGSFVRNANNPMTYAGSTVQSLTAGQVITLRWNTSNNQTLTANLRSLTLIRLGA